MQVDGPSLPTVDNAIGVFLEDRQLTIISVLTLADVRSGSSCLP